VTWRALALPLGILVLAGCGGAEVPSAPATPSDVRAALEQRLVERKLTFRWVVCVQTRRSFAGSPIFRCNVNFGAPHIVRYCATLDDGQLMTNREEPELRCGRDVAG
jgi:hypothetical protein